MSVFLRECGEKWNLKRMELAEWASQSEMLTSCVTRSKRSFCAGRRIFSMRRRIGRRSR